MSSGFNPKPTDKAMSTITRRQRKKEIQLFDQLEPLMHQPLQTYKGNGGVYLQDGDKKIRLSGDRHRTVSAAGKVYWEQLLGVPPPIRYDYNQSLEQTSSFEREMASDCRYGAVEQMVSTSYYQLGKILSPPPLHLDH